MKNRAPAHGPAHRRMSPRTGEWTHTRADGTSSSPWWCVLRAHALQYLRAARPLLAASSQAITVPDSACRGRDEAAVALCTYACVSAWRRRRRRRHGGGGRCRGASAFPPPPARWRRRRRPPPSARAGSSAAASAPSAWPSPTSNGDRAAAEAAAACCGVGTGVSQHPHPPHPAVVGASAAAATASCPTNLDATIAAAAVASPSPPPLPRPVTRRGGRGAVRRCPRWRCGRGRLPAGPQYAAHPRHRRPLPPSSRRPCATRR